MFLQFLQLIQDVQHLQYLQVAVYLTYITKPIQSTGFHARSDGRFTKVRFNPMNLYKLYKLYQRSNFNGGSFSSSGNLRTPIQMRFQR